MQMRTAAASMDELIGAGLLRRLVRSCVLEVQYEEHTPEPYNPGLQSATGLSGGARSTPPPPPRPHRRFETPGPVNGSRPAADGHTLPIWPPPADELARLTAAAEQYPAAAAQQFSADVQQGGTLRFAVPAEAEASVAPPWAAAAAAQYPTPLPAADHSQLTAAEAPPRLEMLPPRAPDFHLGAPLMPERAHDPYYYPGISDEPPPLEEISRPRWRRWAAFAAGGVALFGAGMIVRSFAGSSGASAVIDVTPLDAKVTLDGELVPPTSSPRVREGLIHGEHTLEVERRGFLSQRRVFDVAEGEREQRVVITLLPEPVVPPAAAAPQPVAAAPAPAVPASPAPTSAPAADDEPAKSDKPLSARELAKQRRAEKVAERYRARKAVAADAKASRADAKQAKSEKADRAAQAEPKAGRKGDAGGANALLKLNSTPWSEVYVDDRHVGHTPLLGLPLPAGKHTIRLVNPTLGAKKIIKVRLKAGQTLTKIVKM